MGGVPVGRVALLVLCACFGVAPPQPTAAGLQGVGAPPLEGWTALEGIETAPTLRAEVPWSNDASLLGWSALRVWGRPRQDELRVSAILDAPSHARRWGALCPVEIRADGERAIRTTGAYIGRPMSRGVYDAVRIDVGIDELRAVARARHVEGSVCGDRLELGDAQRDTLRRFVDSFDDLAVPRGPTRGATIERGPELVMPGDATVAGLAA